MIITIKDSNSTSEQKQYTFSIRSNDKELFEVKLGKQETFASIYKYHHANMTRSKGSGAQPQRFVLIFKNSSGSTIVMGDSTPGGLKARSKKVNVIEIWDISEDEKLVRVEELILGEDGPQLEQKWKIVKISSESLENGTISQSCTALTLAKEQETSDPTDTTESTDNADSNKTFDETTQERIVVDRRRRRMDSLEPEERHATTTKIFIKPAEVEIDPDKDHDDADDTNQKQVAKIKKKHKSQKEPKNKSTSTGKKTLFVGETDDDSSPLSDISSEKSTKTSKKRSLAPSDNSVVSTPPVSSSTTNHSEPVQLQDRSTASQTKTQQSPKAPKSPVNKLKNLPAGPLATHKTNKRIKSEFPVNIPSAPSAFSRNRSRSRSREPLNRSHNNILPAEHTYFDDELPLTQYQQSSPQTNYQQSNTYSQQQPFTYNSQHTNYHQPTTYNPLVSSSNAIPLPQRPQHTRIFAPSASQDSFQPSDPLSTQNSNTTPNEFSFKYARFLMSKTVKDDPANPTSPLPIS